MRLLLKIASLLLVTLTAACATAPQIEVRGMTIDETQIAQGQQLFTQYCAACHGVTGQGQFPDTPLEPDTTGRYGAPPHNDAGHTWHHDDELLIRYVREGGMGDPASFYPMPPFGSQLSDDQIITIIAYFKTLWSDEHRAYQQRETDALYSQ